MRLSKIYTRTGDDGDTGLANGERVRKDSLRIQAMGEIDELNSMMGILRSQGELPPSIETMLCAIQHRLFDIGGELSMPGHQFARQTWIDQLEQWLDALNAALPSLKEFILPGGNTAAAYCHYARAVCRRAERTYVALDEPVNPLVLGYLNRLSDLLFVIGRTLARQQGGEEVTWRKDL